MLGLDNDMRSYELVLVLKPSLSAVSRKKIVDTVTDWLKKLKVAKKEEIGERPLSYRIKKENSGFYLDLKVEGDIIPSDFEKRLFNTEDVLRHLLVRVK